MNVEDLIRKSCRKYSSGHGRLYQLLTRHLPEGDIGEPGHCGPHSLEALRRLCPTSGRLLEIGFNKGHSSSIMLGLYPYLSVVSVDKSERTTTHIAAATMLLMFGGRFQYLQGDSRSEEVKSSLSSMSQFDVAFIDGDHSFEGVVSDIRLCKFLGINSMIFDDLLPEYGPGVCDAIASEDLMLESVVGNIGMALVVDDSWLTTPE